MSQRNFGQHRDNNEGGWNGVPDWGSPQQPHQQPSPQRGGFGSSDFGSETTSSLEEEQGFNSRGGFEPQGQRGSGFGYEQPQQPYPNEFQQQGFNQGQNEGWGSQPNQGFEPNGFSQNPQGYPQNQFDSNHYDQYGQMENSASAHPVKKKWSPWSIGLTVVIVAVLLLGIMVFVANKAKQNPSSELKNKVTQVEKGATDKKSAASDSDRIFPEGSPKKEEKTSSSTSAEEKPKEKAENLGGSESKPTTSNTQNLDGAKVSSEVLVAKGVVKELHLEGNSDLAATYKAVLSVGSTTISVSLNFDTASQLKIGDTVTVRYRKLSDVDKVVIESVTK
jgi:putative membrane protein